MAFIRLGENLYAPDHPYHWPTIGSQEDLTAARYEDVVEFFKLYYAPNNASIVIAGDINQAAAAAFPDSENGVVTAAKRIGRKQ